MGTTFEYEEEMSKAVKFSNIFRYIDDLFSINSDNFGKYIHEICPSELEPTLNSLEVCYLDKKSIMETAARLFNW